MIFKTRLNRFEKVIELDSTSGDTYYSLGLLLAEMQNLEEAEKNLAKAAALTGDPTHFYNWALTLQHLKRPEEAEKVYKQALQINPQNERILYALAVLYLQQDQKQKAQNIIGQLLQINPKHPDYQNLLKGLR